MNLARELQQGIEPLPASHGDVYRVRAMDVNTPVDNFYTRISPVPLPAIPMVDPAAFGRTTSRLISAERCRS